MPERPKVSVIVATRDRPGLLERAVAGILAQDYPGEIECLVVYDHVDVRKLDVQSGPGRDVRFVGNTHRPGLPGGRNSGADAATGELFAFCDDDDIWLPAKLRRQVELLADPAIGAVSCGLRLKGPGIDKERVLDRDRVTFDELLADRVMEVHSSTMLVRRATFDAAGPVDEDIPGGYSEDYEWLLRLSALTDIAVCREALVVVDWHGGSFYFGRWATIVDAQRYLIRKHPALARSRTGMARIRGQIAFALASGNRRMEAIRELAAVIRLNPREKRVLVTVPVILGLMTGERVLRMAQKRERVSETAVAGQEVRRSTRSGAIGLAGAAVNGAFGFVLTTVIVRTFGADGSGALFTVIGLLSILGAVCCLGADTGLMWAIPRRDRQAAGGLIPVALLPPLGLALLVGGLGFTAAGPIGRTLLDTPDGTALIRLAFAGVPIIVASTVLLAGVRATRSVTAYVGVQFLFVPIARPVLMIALGGGLLLGFTAWLIPLAVALVIALFLGPRPAGWAGSGGSAGSVDLAGSGGSIGSAGTGPSAGSGGSAADWRPFWAFALPRAASVAIDASSMWVGVLLTGALATQADAGVFAAVGRYALAGLLIMQGLRVAIAPQLSRLLGAGRRAEAAQVYRRTTLGIVLLSWPAYLLLAIFAPAFLSVFGPEFAAGATPMAVLAAAMLVNVGVGLVQTVLLMSGNSRGHLLATVAGLLLNVAGCVALVPRHGALGAAIAWSLGIVCENVIAAVLARRALGAPLFNRALVLVLGTVVSATLAAAALGLIVSGRGVTGLAVTLGVLLVLCLLALLDGRVRARLTVASWRESR